MQHNGRTGTQKGLITYLVENVNSWPVWGLKVFLAGLIYAAIGGGAVWLVGDRLLSHSLSTANVWLGSLDEKIGELSNETADKLAKAISDQDTVNVTVNDDIGSLQGAIKGLTTNVEELTKSVSQLNASFQEQREDINSIRQDVNVIRNNQIDADSFDALLRGQIENSAQLRLMIQHFAIGEQ